MLSKPEAAIKLINDALNAGLVADYVLMDTWFTTEPMIHSILELGLDVIGMVKQLNQRYRFMAKQTLYRSYRDLFITIEPQISLALCVLQPKTEFL